MLSFIRAAISSVFATVLYWFSSIISIFWQSRFVIALLVVYIFNEQVTLALQCFWDYLVANSFCPWLMIFRGRPSGIIIAEVVSHANNIALTSDTSSLISHVFAIGSNIAELVGGPALGIVLTAAFVFITYKCVALIFNKLFNRK